MRTADAPPNHAVKFRTNRQRKRFWRGSKGHVLTALVYGNRRKLKLVCIYFVLPTRGCTLTEVRQVPCVVVGFYASLKIGTSTQQVQWVPLCE